jgi:hypothetical protein
MGIFDSLGNIEWGSRDYRQDKRIEKLGLRLDALSDGKRAIDRTFTATLRILIKKGLITQDEMVAELEAMLAEQNARFATVEANSEGSVSVEALDTEQIAEMDSTATDDTTDHKPQL